MFYNFSLIIIAYLIGAINFAIPICYLFKLPSPRLFGSKNPGATNVLRSGHKLAAVLTLLGDALKGCIPVLLFKYLSFSIDFDAMIGLAIIIGHIYPIYFGFKGGKGVATFIGVTLAFSPYIALGFGLIWFLVALISRYVSAASLLASLSTPFFIDLQYSHNAAYLFFIAVVLIWWKHKENIRRLLAGTENKLTKTL